MSEQRAKIPRSNEDDYSPKIIAERQAFIEAQTGAKLNHTKQFSYDPRVMSGNIENIWGVSQIPIGIAGPLLVDGEYAKGEYFVPMATVEGTMLAESEAYLQLVVAKHTVIGVPNNRKIAWIAPISTIFGQNLSHWHGLPFPI